MSDHDTPKITRYLLGELPPEEMDALEARLLTESGLFELAETVEDDVIDRYARGELKPAEARRFERRLLPSERIRERVEFARALAARGTSREAAERSRPAPVIPLFGSPVRLAWAATLVAALAAGGLAVEVARLQDRTEDLERARSTVVAQLEEARRSETPPLAIEDREEDDREAERLAAELASARERIAALEAHDEPRDAAETGRRVRKPREIVETGNTVSQFLALATRTDAGAKTLALGDAAGAELQLDLGGQRPAGAVIATVTRGGQPVWQGEVEVEDMEGESMARLVLPRESLLEGRYRVELTEGEPGGAERLLGTYELSVTP